MIGLDSLSSSMAASRAGGQQVRLRESKRAAEQAEQTAQNLRRQADEAQRDADRSQDVARDLGTSANQAETRASQVRRGSPVVESVPIFSAEGVPKVSVASNPDTPPVANADKASPSGSGRAAVGVLNLSGQRLGQFINVAV